jgi:hypothetical protein
VVCSRQAFRPDLVQAGMTRPCHLHSFVHTNDRTTCWRTRLLIKLFVMQFSSASCHLVRFEIFTAVRMMMFFWVLVPCRLVGTCQRFGETYCLHLQGWSGDGGNWRDLYRFGGWEGWGSGPIRDEEWGGVAYKYSTQHPVLKYPQPMLFVQCERPGETPIRCSR